jgi:spermidine/putrescine transport system permease protein
MRRKSALSAAYMVFILTLMYVPILLVILYSVNKSRLSSIWGGFSLVWYRQLFADRSMFQALRNSLVLGITSSILSAIIGTAGAVGARHTRSSRHSNVKAARNAGIITDFMEFLSILPVMLPEIILGMVSLAWFGLLRIPTGMATLIIAHTSFCIPYTYLLVKARLHGMDANLPLAARNLGAGAFHSFFDITLPLIMPAVLSGMLLAFAMSFDDVIISVFVSGINTNTLPVKIYTQMKTGVTPKTNALCTLLFAATILLCLLALKVSHGPPTHKSQAKSV